MYKTLKLHTQHRFFLTAILFSAVIVFGIITTTVIYKQNIAHAILPPIPPSVENNVSGWAWNESVGWISFNCENTASCASVDYGVTIDSATGDFSGYAWSDNVGWVSFEPADVAGCPSGTCQSNLAGDDTVSGWAKILSEGADGWISLSGTSPDYEVTYNSVTKELEGWAWNDTIGWISFNHKGCDADEDGFSDGNIGCPVLGTPIPEYAVTHLKVYNDTTWVKVFGGEIRSVATTTGGGYIVAGLTSDFGTGGINGLVMKLNKEGDQVWAKAYGRSTGWYVDSFDSVRQTSDGGYILGGSIYSGSTDSQNLLIVKLDANGNQEWFKNLGYGGGETSADIQQTSDGGYVVFGSKAFSGDSDWLVAKLDSIGNEIWVKTYDSDSDNDIDLLHSGQQTSDGGYILAGELNAYTGGGTNSMLIKIDSAGNIVWRKVIDGGGTDIFYSVQQTLDSGYIVAGSNSYDFLIVKYDNAGNRIWTKTVDGTYSAQAVYQTDDGGYVIAGTGDSSDIVVMKLDSNGVSVWAKVFEGRLRDYVKSNIQQTPDGGYIFGGRTSSYGPSYDTNSFDIILLKLDSEGNADNCYPVKDIVLTTSDLSLSDLTPTISTFVETETESALAPTITIGTPDRIDVCLTDSLVPSSPTNLRVSKSPDGTLYDDPVGFDYSTPFFSAIYVDGNSNEITTHYRIQLTTADDIFYTSLVWDSGKTENDFPFCIQGNRCERIFFGSPKPYGDMPILEWGGNYIWRIQFWNYDIEGPWSGDAIIEMTNEALTARFYSGEGDGSVSNYDNISGDGSQADWNTTHDAISGVRIYGGENGHGEIGPSVPDFEGYHEIVRTFFPFNTSFLPDESFVTDSSFGLYIEGAGYDTNDGYDWLNLVQTTQATTNSLSNDDFDQCGSVNNPQEGATRIDSGDIVGFSYNTWSLNETGKQWITKDGWTKLGIRDGHDALDVRYDGGDMEEIPFIMLSEYVYISSDPYLEVTYSNSSPPTAPTITGPTTGDVSTDYEFNFVSSPTEVGYIQDTEQGGTAQVLEGASGIYISGFYAYVTSEYDDGISIIDISDPTNPTEVGYIQDTEQGGTAQVLDGPYGIHVSGNYAYVTSYYDGGLSIIDISDPTNPTEVGYIQDTEYGGTAQVLDGANGVYISGNYAYVTSYYDDGLSIIDISDPTNPTEVGYIQDTEQGGTAQVLDGANDVYISGSYAYVSLWEDDGLSIIDISDPTNPTEVGYIQDNSQSGTALLLDGARGVHVSGNYAYVTSHWGGSGLSIIDISDPTNPTEVGYIQNKGSYSGTAQMLSGAYGVYVSGNYAYVAAWGDGGISIIDISDPINPTEIGCTQDTEQGGTAQVLEGARGIYVSGNYAYVTSSRDDGLSIIDISNIPNNLRYGIDWDMDDTVDEWAPSFSYVISGTTQSVITQWSTTGDKTFQVLAENVGGLRSNWTPHTITIEIVGDSLHAPTITGSTTGAVDTNYEFGFVATDIQLEHVGTIIDFEAFENTYDIYVSGNYAYTTSHSDGLGVLDISDPANPTQVGTYALTSDTHSIYVSGNYAYVTSYYGDSVEIIDISDPTNPTHVVEIFDNPTAALDGAYDIYVSGNYAYVASGRDDGVEILDISDPTNPTHVGAIFDNLTTALDGAHGIYVSGDYAYVTAASEGLSIIDISDPTNPTHVGSLYFGASYLAYSWNVYVSGNYAYVAGWMSKSVKIIDISDPTNPTHIGAIFDNVTTALDHAHSIHVSGNYAYVTGSYDDGVEILDISNPANPTHVGVIFDDATTALDGASGLHVSGNYAYVAGSSDDGVEILDISDPANPTHVGAVYDKGTTALDGAQGIYVLDDYAYVAGSGNDGVEIIDISDPANPTHIGAIFDNATTALSQARDIHVSGNYAYVASRSEGMEILDISDPANPTHVGAAFDFGAYGIHVSGNYAYMTDYYMDSVEILDISDPTNPTNAGTVALGTPYGIYISGNYAYVTNHDMNSVEILDISDPTNPIHITGLGVLSGPTDIYISGNYAYITGASSPSNKGVDVLDISDPTNPTKVGSIYDNDTTALDGAQGIYLSGNYAYVASRREGVEILDISDPTNPTHVVAIFDNDTTALNGAHSIHVSGNYAYVTNYNGDSVVILNITDSLRYGIDWGDDWDVMDGVVDEWLPSFGYVLSGTTQSSTTQWTTTGDKTFQALAEDDGGLQSGWTQHTITIGTGNTLPTADIWAPNSTPLVSPISLTGEFSDVDIGDTFNGFEWRDGHCDTGTLLYSSSTLQANNPTLPHSQALSDGDHDIYFRVLDNQGGWSACEMYSVTINPSSQCSDNIDNDGDPWLWFDDGLIGDGEDRDHADPACYDVSSSTNPIYHSEYNDESADPQCSDNTDNDSDGLSDINDPGCHTDGDPTNAGSYDKFDNDENNCGTGVCEIGETYVVCPQDCPFVWIEF